MVILFLLYFNPTAAGAQVAFTPQVQVGEFSGGTVDANTTGEYIKAVYNYGIGVAGILSAIVMMFGGILWLTAGGDSGKVAEAKEWIKSSLFGLILILLSYTILLTISPDLVNFKPLKIDKIKQSSAGRSNGLLGADQYGISGFSVVAKKEGYVRAIDVIGDPFFSIVQQDKDRYSLYVDSSGTAIPGTYLDKTDKTVYGFFNGKRDDGTSYIGIEKYVKKN